MAGIKKHSVILDGHKTSVSLEPAFWRALSEIADSEGRSLNALISEVDRSRDGNLSSALRLYVLSALEARARNVSPSEATPRELHA